MCVLVARALEQAGWETAILGPRTPQSRLQFRAGVGYLAMARSAMRAASAAAPDLVISNGYLGGGHTQAPRIHVYHGTLLAGTRALAGLIPRREVLRRSAAAGTAELLAGRTASRVVCVSDQTATEVRRLYRLAGTTVIPNCVDTETFSPGGRAAARASLGLPAAGRCALFVGRFDPGKGTHIALEAAVRAGYQLIVAGNGAPPGARHLGVLAPEQLVEAYRACDCVLLPSRYEGCSFTVLESMACGRPIITTAVGWMKTLLEHVPGYAQLCAAPQREQVQAVLEALRGIDTARLTEEARAFVSAHNDFRQWANEWRELADELVSAHRRPSIADSRRGGERRARKRR